MYICSITYEYVNKVRLSKQETYLQLIYCLSALYLLVYATSVKGSYLHEVTFISIKLV